MTGPSFEPLMALNVEGYFPPHELGLTSRGRRRFVNMSGGSFEGKKLRGVILPGGEDRALVRADGLLEINAQCIAKTHDDAMILIMYRGVWDVPQELLEPLLRREITVDPSVSYWRTILHFETSAPQYLWLNRILAIGIGKPAKSGALYDVFQLL